MKRTAASTIYVLCIMLLVAGHLVSCSNKEGNSGMTPSSAAPAKTASSDNSGNAAQVVSAQTGTAEYVITDLGTLGEDWRCAYGINNKGQVVGAAQTTTGDRHAFLYSNGGMTDLGTLGGSESFAWGISDSGQVVGWANITAEDNHAFLYSNGSMTDLGTFGGRYSSAQGINNKGQVVGAAYLITPYHHAFLYSNGSMTDLGTLGGSYSTAYGINDSGQVVGFASTPDINHFHAFLYSNGSMTDLGTLGGSYSSAKAINNKGQVVGWANTAPNPTAEDVHAFLYSNGSMTDLGILGGRESLAHGINNSGQIVGESDTDLQPGPHHAFLYSNGKMVDLNDLIPADSGWILGVAYGINDYGQIAGCGSINYTYSAFLLTPVNYYTGTGAGVTVSPKDITTGTTPVVVTFATVTAPGATTLTTSEQGPPPDAGFKLGNPPVYYDISTTAMYTPPVTICIDYSGISFGNENSLSLRHYEDTNGDGTPDKWVDLPTVNDRVNKIICAEVSSLSIFAIFEPAWQFTGFFRPIDNLPAMNVVNAGQAIPVKWRVTKADGTPVSDTASVRSLASYEVNCGDLTGEAGSAVSGSAAGRSGLQYQGDGYWQFNWKTLKSYDDQCRRMVLTLGDGSTHEAVFTFR